MTKLIYLPQATREIIEIRRYIARRSGSRRVASEFIGKLRAKCKKLASLPGRMGSEHPEIHGDLRSYPLGNYLILFRYRDERFEVVSVLERHRDIAALFERGPD